MDSRVVYMAKNNVNGKKYVGQTANFDLRKREHLYMASRPQDSRNTPFTRALHRYGHESFTWDVLFVCNLQDVNMYEAKAIRFHYSLCSEHGYNVKDGSGEGCRSSGQHRRKHASDDSLPKGITRTPTGYAVRLRDGQHRCFTAQWVSMDSKLNAAMDWLQAASVGQGLPRKMKRRNDMDDALPSGVYRVKNGYDVRKKGFPCKSFTASSQYSQMELMQMALQYFHNLGESHTDTPR